MTHMINYQTTTLCLAKGTTISEFVSERPLDVRFDPVTKLIFNPVAASTDALKGDFKLEFLKIPITDFDPISNVSTIPERLKAQGWTLIHEYLAVLLWHQDPDILADGEGAVVITPVLEQAMLGKHMFSLSRTSNLRCCFYAPIRSDNVRPSHSVQWCIVARQP